MPNIPKGAKVPDDHKTKSAEDDGTFTFEHGGKSFTSKSIVDVITPKFIRQNRRRDTTDFFFTLLEDIFEGDDGAIAALDEMDWAQMNATILDMKSAMNGKVDISLGE